MKGKLSPKNKLYFFLRRYGYAELISAIFSYLLAWMAAIVWDDKILVSYLASAGAFLGFYIVMIIRELKGFDNTEGFSQSKILKIISSNLLIEFGFSEILDIFLFRPACIYIAQISIPNFTLAIITGNIAANILFFLISAFMFSRKDVINSYLKKINLISSRNKKS